MPTGKRLTSAVWTMMLAFSPLPTRAEAQAERSVLQDERDALHNLMAAALSAAREGDHGKLEEIAGNLMIPDYESWFKATFREELGPKVAAD